MPKRSLARCHQWYQNDYKQNAFLSQRLYPNEELLRFMGRNFFSMPPKDLKKIKILEVGCGTCANLWMIAWEGFSAYGIDLSSEAVALGKMMLKRWGVKAELATMSMTDIRYPEGTFDVVVDIFSSYCLALKDFAICLDEVGRVLKPGGRFFSYTPSTASEAFKSHAPSRKLDERTIDGIRRSTSPYLGNLYPFRFISPSEYERLLQSKGFRVTRLETTGRTYREMQEYFEFVVVEAVKEK